MLFDFDKLKNIFTSLTKNQQRGLIVGSVVAFLIMIISFILLSQTYYGVLFKSLSQVESMKIVAELEQMSMPYKLENGGSKILVEQEHINSTRLKLMAKKLNLNHTVGFELFDKNDFGMTEFSQAINLQRALQGELERTINSFDEVLSTRVHLSLPKKNLFEQQTTKPKASVVLNLSSDVSAAQLSAIQQLISSSVDKLAVEQVFITDLHGHLLKGRDFKNADLLSFKNLQYKQKLENYLQAKAQKQLLSLFDNELALVNIDVDIDDSQQEKIIEKPLAEKNSGLIKHKKTHQHKVADKAQLNKQEDDIDTELSYVYGKEVTNIHQSAGRIKRLTISVVVPEFVKHEQFKTIQQAIANAVGFNKLRGDEISITSISKHIIKTNIAPIVIAEKTKFIDLLTTKILIIISILALFIIILVVFSFIRYKKTRLYSEPELNKLAEQLFILDESKAINYEL